MGAPVSPALVLEGIGVAVGGLAILRDISMAVGPGETVALLGPSGSGKSTLLRVILGLLPATTGRVCIDGRTATEGPTVAVPPERRQLSMVFQDLALWPHLDVRGHLAFVLGSQGIPSREHPGRIEPLLGRLGLQDKADRRPGQLSGGERQRVALARALVTTPAALLLDEPLANVDVALKQEMLQLLGELLRERGTPAIYVTHDPREAVKLTGRAVVLEQGSVVQDGPLDLLRARPATPFVRQLVEAIGESSP
jgi:ABC-type Fe3+/spermidine/putrescine transport system ATPase subunit